MKKLTVILFLFAHVENVFCFGNVSEALHTKIVGFIVCFQEMILLGAQPRCSSTKIK